MTELAEKIIALRAEGKTYNEIKGILGCSKGTISYYLSEDGRDKNARRQRDRRRTVSDYFQKIKQETPCADCGEDYPFWVMDFDHLGDKEFQISRYRHHGKTLEDVKREIAKCEIVCANSHRARTHSRKVYSETNSEYMDVSSYYK